jgi:TolB-like protein/Tfp pilus assembly protein PilF
LRLTDIFLSYNREDQAVAKQFADGLEAQGLSVWWDVGLKTGEAYDEVTEAALRTAKAVLVLWSPQSVKSRWVRAEALLAQRLGTLAPVMIAPCERPIMFELTQTADLTGWKGSLADPLWIAFLSDMKSRLRSQHEPKSGDQAPPLRALMSGAPRPDPQRRALLWTGGAALLLSTAGAGLWLATNANRDQTRSESGTSIAILPFANISGDAAQNYFAEGLSAEVRAELARNTLLQVAAQTSSAAMKDLKDGAIAIAKTLGVAYLLEGNVRKGPDTIRVNADLIDGATGFSKWSQTFDRPLENVFEVQNEIASAVALALAVQMTSAMDRQSRSDKEERPVGGTLNVAAFEHFLRGRELFESAQSEQTDREALGEFDAAIAQDKDYAAAYAGRARVLAVLANQSATEGQIRQLQKDAIVAAQTAVRLAPDFAAGHSALGLVYFQMKLDAKAAKEPFEKSLLHGAGDGDVVTGHAVYSARIGDHAAAATSIAKALRLDPLNPTVFRSAGQVEAAAHRYASALPYYDRALTLNPKMSTAHFLKGEALVLLGKVSDARTAFEAEPNRLFRQTGLTITALKSGNKGQADRMLQKLVDEFGDASAYQQAQIHAQANDLPKALDALVRARKYGDAGLILAKNDQMLDPIRQEPLFLDLLKSIGLI